MASQVIIEASAFQKQRLGYSALSFDSMVATTAVTIKAGGKCEISGALYDFTADETESGGTWAGIANSTSVYIYIVPAGSTATWIYSDTAPTWNVAKQGWYNGSNRAIGFLWKDAGGNYVDKNLLGPFVSPRGGKLRHLPLDNTTGRGPAQAFVPNIANWTAALQVAGSYGVPLGAKGAKLKVGIKPIASGAGYTSIYLAASDNDSDTPTDLTAHPVASGTGYATGAGGIGTYFSEIDVPLNALGQFYFYNLLSNNVSLPAGSFYEWAVAGYRMGD